MKIVNLTPHSVNLFNNHTGAYDAIAPSGIVARVAATTVPCGTVGAYAATTTSYGDVVAAYARTGNYLCGIVNRCSACA